MGIEDRDYSRERVRRAGGRRRSAGWSTSRVAFVWIAIGAALFLAFRSLLRVPPDERPRVPPPPAAAPPADVPVRRASAPEAVRVAPPPLPERREHTSSIYRCGSSYGTSPCAGGRTVATPAATGFDSRPSERLASLVAAGRSSDGSGATSGTTTTTSQTVSTGNGAACAELAADIVWIDHVARQPQPAPVQDRLRARRQADRDRQAALHC